MIRREYYILVFCFALSKGLSQGVLSLPINISERQLPMRFIEFIEKVEQEKGVRFFFNPSWIGYLTVNRSYSNMPLSEVLNQVLSGSDISYSPLFNYGIILIKDPTKSIERERLLQKAIAEQKTIQRLTIGEERDYNPDKKLKLRGVVSEESNGAFLKNATVGILDSDDGVITNEQGYFELILAPGEHLLSFRHANFAEKIVDLRLFSNGQLNITLEEVAILLDEVIVADNAIVNKNIGQLTLKISDMKRTPTFLGEVDVIKQVQQQAGVSSVGEVAAGFNVRGGGVDQNMVLYDGMPVFNPAHALGFFSSFNSDNLSQVSFYKSGLPAEFGGRASSVLNVTSKEGNPNKWSGGGGIGLISTHANLHGPIKKDTTTLLASFRTTYSNWMLNLIKSNYVLLDQSAMSFYDGSIKLAHKFSTRSKLTASTYSSTDQMKLTNDTLFQWTNFITSVRWDKTTRGNLFYSLTAGIGRYAYTIKEPQPEQAFDLTYKIFYPVVKADFNYVKKNPVSFGIHTTMYSFSPGSLKPTSVESLIVEKKIPEERAIETAFYYNQSFRWGDRFVLDAGIRYSLYARVGPGTVFQYQTNEPMEPRNVVDSVLYGSNKPIKWYHGPEPRVAIRYSITPISSVKASYDRMYQFVHLISNSAAVTPIDIWQLSNFFFEPQIADQVSVGYFRTLRENTIEFSGEVFYKTISNILDFKNGAQLILNNKLETALINGNAESYGIELSASKIKGRFQGGLNYTWSRSWHQMNGRFESEKINEGTLYPSNFDQPHILNMSWRYGITRRHFFTGNFSFHTGRPISLPAQVYYVDNIGVSDFPMRNTYRLPDYHRLDLAFVIEGNHKRKKLWNGNWVVSAYNVYARKNAYSVFFRQDEYGILKPYQLSVIGTIIPTVTYNFKF